MVQLMRYNWMQEIQDHELRRLAHEHLDEAQGDSDSESQESQDSSENETTSHLEKEVNFLKRFH